MKLINRNLILAVAGAMIVFATGCTKKPSRPTLDQTLIDGGAGYTTGYTTTTVAPPVTTTYTPVQSTPSSGVAGTYVAPQFGNPSVFAPVTTAPAQPADTLSNRTDGGILNGNEIRGINSLQPVYFDFDRSAIKSSEYGKIQAVKDYLAKNPAQKVLFEGHCDWRGTAEYNMALGDRRANAARRYAISIGIPADKIQTRSVGSSDAKERGSETDMAQDRRAEVVILVK